MRAIAPAKKFVEDWYYWVVDGRLDENRPRLVTREESDIIVLRTEREYLPKNWQICLVNVADWDTASNGISES